MLSLITSHVQIPNSHFPFSSLNTRLTPPSFILHNPQKSDKLCKNAFIPGRYFGLTEVRWAPDFGRNLHNSWCCWCTQNEGDLELDAEILDFMEKSEKPSMFPSKDELMRAGRVDLVEAIEKVGGFYSLGWDEENASDYGEEVMDLEIAEFQRRIESHKESTSSREQLHTNFRGDDNEDYHSSSLNLNLENLDALRLNASAKLDKSAQIVADELSGIEGILSRLDKQRNEDLGLHLGKTVYEVQSKSKDEGDDRHFDTSSGFGRTDLEDNFMPGFHLNEMLDSSGGNVRHYTEPETWRTWSSRRAGFQTTEFEAAEISFGKNQVDADQEIYSDEIMANTKEYAEDCDQLKEINYNDIRTRLQHLESELATTLHLMRSKRKDSIKEEISGSFSGFQNLSDEFEFQENEFMSAKGRLRSIRARLAVLEGKMALAIVDAQKILEVKQKRIDDAHKALQLLRTTCIVWPNSASKVLLAGSFDGWTTQRRMEKSKSGVFSVSLKLYPGRYEIKFIVDGKWKVDPLRPIVNNNGYENNLFIVT